MIEAMCRKSVGTMLSLVFTATILAVSPAAIAQSRVENDPVIEMLRQGRILEAEKLARNGIARNPKSAQALFAMGRVSMSKKSDEAVEWFEKAVAADQRNSLYHFWLGQAYGRQAQRASKFRQPFLAKKVQAEFEKARDLDPSSIDPRVGLVEFYLLAPGFMGGGEDKALAEVSEIRKRDALMGHLMMGRVYRKQKRLDLVEKEYLSARKAYPNREEPYLWLGSHYEGSKQFQKAFDVYEGQLRDQPDNMSALYQIGKVASVSGQNLDRGLEAMTKYLRHTPKEGSPPLANAHYRLGGIYEKKGNRDEARKAYREALRLNPELKDAREALAKLGA
ncbi:MAG TPA: tetratricopeptide repeat protein [Thermoanaerobaculia bacterium]|nr:tetratricopeptide repeat protein [Thermoanaerobaculia bacterium]